MKTLNSSTSSNSLPRGNCPPFTPDDVFALKGKPVAKRFESLKNPFFPLIEEWIYYHTGTNTKESYKFKSGYLVGWTKDEIE
jgi:hypothetical protein